MDNHDLMPETPVTPVLPPKKNGTMKFIIPLAVILVVVCVIAGIILFILLSNPKKTVAEGIINTFASASHPIREYLDTDALTAMMDGGKIKEELTLSLDDLNDGYSDFSDILTLSPNLSLSYLMDYPSKKAMMSLKGNLATSTLLDFGFYFNDTKAAVTAPDFWDNYLEFDTTTLAADFNQSIFSQMAGETFPEDLNMNLFGEDGTVLVSFEEAYKERYAEDLAALIKAITVQKSESLLVSFQDGERKCKGYDITIPANILKKNYNNMIDLYYELGAAAMSASELGDMKAAIATMKFPETVNLTVFIDKKTKAVVNLLHEGIYTVDGETYTIRADISWLGSAFLNDLVEADFKIIDVHADEITVQYTASSSAAGTAVKNNYAVQFGSSYEEEDMTFTCDSSFDSADGSLTTVLDAGVYDSTVSVMVEGAFSDVNKGKSFTFDLSDLTMVIASSADDKSSFTLSGSASVSELTEEISLPEGTAIDLLHMNQSEVQAFSMSIIEKFSDSPLGDLLLGL